MQFHLARTNARKRALSLFALATLVAACSENPNTLLTPPNSVPEKTAAVVTTNQTFGSGISAVTAYDPIFPAAANSDWPTRWCTATPAVGVNAAWANPHSATVFAPYSHPWETSAQGNFNARWINAWPNLSSTGMGGPGHSWTKYTTQVEGTGSFVVQMLADNCSWIYLDNQLIGYQNNNWSSNPAAGKYTLTLNGTHTMTFIIFDGGGLAGGKFLLQTSSTYQGPVTDGTPPVIKPTVTGTLGTNDWYKSNVHVTWSVTDAESAVASKSGCADADVTTDTDGITFTCSATSAGGTASKSVTVKRDATPPQVAYTGNTSPYTFDAGVTVLCSATDASPGSGIATNTCSNITGTGATFGVGSHAFSATATDNAGNTASASTTIVVSDNSPPVIKPIITGQLGNNGWYTGNVHVEWSVTDAESAVTGKTGCDAVDVTADTPGALFTCSATSAGGTASESVTIKRDATAPAIAYSGNTSPYTFYQNVNVTCTANDGGSGVASNTCANITGTGASLGLGSHAYSATVTDNAGHTASANTIVVVHDVTPPVITPTVSGTLSSTGWYTSNVGVSWSVTDPESPVSSSTGCTSTTTSTDGLSFAFTCAATSAGGTDSKSVTFKRDATRPTIAFTGNQGTYSVDQHVTIGCTATDATSQIASSNCPTRDADAYTFGVGTQTLDASATDKAGNSSAASTQFTVTVNSTNVCALVKRWVNKEGVAHSMCQQLANGAYGAFVNHVQAQTDKSVLAANAAVLISLARQL